MNKLSAIVIARNEAKNIEACLASLAFADEKVVIDGGSSDATPALARKMSAKVFLNEFIDFASQRNFAMTKAVGDWLLFVDADERVSGVLAAEIRQVLKKPRFVAYRLPRKNFYFQEFPWPKLERLERLFAKKALRGWFGKVHESPLVEGTIGDLNNPLLHYTHTDFTSMLEKTNQWSEMEAETIFHSGHPRLSWWRFLRIMLTKFAASYFGQGGWRLGTAGFVESFYQAYSYFVIYAKVWEKQIHAEN